MVCYPTLKCYLPFAGRAAHSGPRLGAPAWNGTQGAFVCYSDDEWNRINPAVRLKAARCKARAAFELCGSPAVVGTAGWRSKSG
jgi:hypothetical protein